MVGSASAEYLTPPEPLPSPPTHSRLVTKIEIWLDEIVSSEALWCACSVPNTLQPKLPAPGTATDIITVHEDPSVARLDPDVPVIDRQKNSFKRSDIYRFQPTECPGCHLQIDWWRSWNEDKPPSRPSLSKTVNNAKKHLKKRSSAALSHLRNRFSRRNIRLVAAPRDTTKMYTGSPSRRPSNPAGGRDDDTGDTGSVETLGASSDDERRKPKLTIDATAARLRRAQRLLQKTTQTVGPQPQD
ncbi:hypothetical protein F4778DRAFT_102925 [Xylariomycetidae sp. FL2044]|nr:hypothetical protein F4778DRAFT_102925 [Xylariomycetidae sp. FL2044]